MPVEPAPTRWAFPPLDDAEPDGPVAVGGDLEPGTLLHAYRRGLFPMPIGRRDRLGWFSPDPRAILPPADFHVSRSLRRSARRAVVSVDRAFRQVMVECGHPRRPHGWINEDFVEAYTRLHEMGWAHSVEVWHGERLVGGVYGVAIGAFFAGESMFHRETDASKVALLHLCRILSGPRRERTGTAGCAGRPADALFDVQWLTPHLASLGAVEVPRATYLGMLDVATRSAGPRWESYDDAEEETVRDVAGWEPRGSGGPR